MLTLGKIYLTPKALKNLNPSISNWRLKKFGFSKEAIKEGRKNRRASISKQKNKSKERNDEPEKEDEIKKFCPIYTADVAQNFKNESDDSNISFSSDNDFEPALPQYEKNGITLASILKKIPKQSEYPLIKKKNSVIKPKKRKKVVTVQKSQEVHKKIKQLEHLTQVIPNFKFRLIQLLKH